MKQGDLDPEPWDSGDIPEIVMSPVSQIKDASHFLIYTTYPRGWSKCSHTKREPQNGCDFVMCGPFPG